MVELVTLEQQILERLGRARDLGGLTAYELARSIERAYPREPHRFLWWSWPWRLNHSTLLRELARLEHAGTIRSERQGDRWVYRRAIWRSVGVQMSSSKSPPLVIE